jgi:hypothetical protein
MIQGNDLSSRAYDRHAVSKLGTILVIPLRSREAAPCQVGEHFPRSAVCAFSEFLRCSQHVVIDVQCGSHASDACINRPKAIQCVSNCRKLLTVFRFPDQNGTMFLLLSALLLIPALMQAPAAAPAMRVSGRVVNGETGRPFAGAIVTLSNSSGNTSKRSVTVGADGSFEFLNVLRGHYLLRAEDPQPNIPSRTETMEIEVLSRDLNALGLIISPAVPKVEIAGRVVIANGGSLPSAISAVQFSGESAPVRADASFQLRLRPAQKYVVTLDRPVEGYYVESVSMGEWDAATGTWIFRDKPGETVQVTLSVGRRRIRGRILSAGKTPAPQSTATLMGPAPATAIRDVVLGSDATFSFGGMRSGEYELRAKHEAGDNTQAGLLRFSVEAQDRYDLELVLQSLTLIKGQVVVPGSRTMEELMLFKPYVELSDAMGKRRVTIDANGAFQFRSFDGDFVVEVKNLPVEFRVDSISTGPSSVDVLLEILQGDVPGFRFLQPRTPLR